MAGDKKPLVIDLPLGGSEYFRILDENRAEKMRSGLVTLKPGEEVGAHDTEDYEELIVVLEGSGEVEADSAERKKLGRGQAAYNPPHTRHNVLNTGAEPMRYIYIVSKA